MLNLFLEPGASISGAISNISQWPVPIDEDGPCSICLNPNKIRPVLLQCGHTYCNPCIQDAMANQETNPTCPYCRAEIYEYLSLDSNRVRRPRDKTRTDPEIIFQEFVYPSGVESEDSDYSQPAESLTLGETGRPSPTFQQEASDSDATELLEQSQLQSPPSSQASATQASSDTSVVYLCTVEPNQLLQNYPPSEPRTQSQPIDLSVDTQPGPSSGAPRSGLTASQSQPSRGLGIRFQIYFAPIVEIEAHRGLGRSIRYLVVWEDGTKSWEPTRHMALCEETLKVYRRKLKVKHQQAYRRRKTQCQSHGN